MKRERASLGRRIESIAFLLIFLLGTSIAQSQNFLKISLYINEKEIWVEVARTPAERAKGLMGRKHLGQEEGMFFIFESEDYHAFWMKDTLVALSIAFIDKSGRFVAIADMKHLSLISHSAPKPVL